MKKLWVFTMSSTSLSGSVHSILPSDGKSNTDNHSIVDIANEFIRGNDHRKKVFGARFEVSNLDISC